MADIIGFSSALFMRGQLPVYDPLFKVLRISVARRETILCSTKPGLAATFERMRNTRSLAFILAQHLSHLKELIQRGREGREEAIAGIERAVESLMPHTHFRDAGRSVYRLAVAGNLSPEQEQEQ